jgi:hypothetical protein
MSNSIQQDLIKAQEREALNSFVYKMLNMLVADELILDKDEKFVTSLMNWKGQRGFLSDKQIDAAFNMIKRNYHKVAIEQLNLIEAEQNQRKVA